jgi:hypothetical protein
MKNIRYRAEWSILLLLIIEPMSKPVCSVITITNLTYYI